MSLIFLSDLEVQQLTGRHRPTAQCHWLQKHGWKHDINAIGRPVVAIAEAERKLVGKPFNQPSGKEPNWEVLNG